MRAAIAAGSEFDATSLLSEVKSPTLVLHRRQVVALDIAIARGLAARIPDARLVVVEGTSMAPQVGDIGRMLHAIDEFLSEGEKQASAARPAATVRAVLFTDLVGHTEMMQSLGDAKGREVLREHERITRETLKAHGGTEVKTMGDGFMASFGSVTKAVECAVALQRAFADREGEPLQVRCGLNAGEPIEEDGDLFGATVILASRIAAKAEGGEILVADTVRGLCSGKGFSFADRGEFVAKGIEEPVRVFEVRWRDG
jgi:class 3 adenylate cyclase